MKQPDQVFCCTGLCSVELLKKRSTKCHRRRWKIQLQPRHLVLSARPRWFFSCFLGWEPNMQGATYTVHIATSSWRMGSWCTCHMIISDKNSPKGHVLILAPVTKAGRFNQKWSAGPNLKLCISAFFSDAIAACIRCGFATQMKRHVAQWQSREKLSMRCSIMVLMMADDG